MAEEDLVRHAQDGDLGAFERLVRTYHPRLLAYASRRVSDFDAEEIVQETFLKAFGGLRILRIPARFGPWLYAICRNEIVNSIRVSAAASLDDDIECVPDLADGKGQPTDGTANEELLHAVARLRNRHRDVIRMRYFDGLRLGRIASILGVRESLVKSRLHEAREVLRRSLPGTTEAARGASAFMPLLKEAIMKSVELTKNAASAFARLSLEDQLGICDAVVQRRRFDSTLVERISRLEGGMEFLQGSDAHLDERELAAVLNFADEGVRARFLAAAKKRHQSPIESLRRTMVLPELNAQDESLRLESEVIEGCDGCILISLNGYIDTHNTHYFMQRLTAIVTAGYGRLILDCAGLNYISSAGVGAMTALRNELSRRSGDICVLAMQAALREVFRALCIADFFVFCEDRAEALRWAPQSGGRKVADSVSESADFREARRYLLQLDTSKDGAPLQTRKVEDDSVSGFGYVGMSRPMSSDYLFVQRLDERRLGAIVSDASGRGKDSANAVVKVAALFQSFVSGWRASEIPSSLERLAYAINDALYGEASPVTFCAFQALVLDGQTGDCAVVHAGTPRLLVFDPGRRALSTRELASTPSAGSFSNALVREKTGFRVERFTVRPGESLLLCTDGVEESQRRLRNAHLEPVSLGQGHRPFEQFGFKRFAAIVAAALTRGRYELVRESCGGTTRRDIFDFSRRAGTVKDAVLALAAVEELFRLTPLASDARPEAEHGPGVAVLAPEVDRMLAECLEGYSDMFSRRVRTLVDAVHYGGLLQEEQFDEVALLGIGRKEPGSETASAR